jgi:hypothetical protein
MSYPSRRTEQALRNSKKEPKKQVGTVAKVKSKPTESDSTEVAVWEPTDDLLPSGSSQPGLGQQGLSQQGLGQPALSGSGLSGPSFRELGLSHLTPRDLENLRVLSDRFGAVANDVATGRAAAGAAPQFNAEIAAGLYSGDSNWRYLYYSVLLVNPDPLARVALARTGPLGILRALVYDPDPTVRYAILENPMVADADIQAALAADPEEAIVLGLLATVSSSRRSSAAIIAGPHSKAKQLLASKRVSTTTLKALANDADPLTRVTAKKQLAGRRQLNPGGK